jgi:hypothetical protein
LSIIIEKLLPFNFELVVAKCFLNSYKEIPLSPAKSTRNSMVGLESQGNLFATLLLLSFLDDVYA